MTKSTTEAVRKSRDKRGVTRKMVALTPEELALWDEMSDLYGGRKKSLLKALRLLKSRDQVTLEDVRTFIDDLAERALPVT